VSNTRRCSADPTVPSCGNIYATGPTDAVEFDCTGARYGIAQSPAAIVCGSGRCSARECCTSVRPTCADINADGSGVLFDCTVAVRFLDHSPAQVFCTVEGCSITECCTADTPLPPSPPATGTQTCTSADELLELLDTVNSVCCDDGCASGYPTTCDAACAQQLLPIQAACTEMLSVRSMVSLSQQRICC
jgi:hypothetical protein